MQIIWLIFSILLIVAGGICIANPSETMMFLAYFMGFIMLFSGIFALLYFFQARFFAILLDGIISCAFGLVLLFGGEDLAQNFVPLFIALWLVLKGILWLIHSFRLSRANFSQSGAIMIIGALYVVLGIIFVLFPALLSVLISLFIGVGLILSGITSLYFWNLTRVR